MVLARSLMCYLLCGTRLFQQSMRNTLTNVLVLIAAEARLSTAEKGSLLAMIPLGYFLTQVPGGALADAIGAKNVMTAAVGASALCCLALPTMFDTFGLSGMLGTLVLMGAVQGPMFPTSSVFLARWMPKAAPGQPDEKAWGTSMLDVGISVGTLLIIPTVTFLADAVGWRHTYHVVGGASLGFVAVWQALAASSPAESWLISKEELAFLEANVPKPAAKPAGKAGGGAGGAGGGGLPNSFLGMPWAVALHAGTWAVFVAHMAFNFGAYYLTNWSQTYYKDVLGVPPAQAYVHLMVPHVTNLAVKSANPAIEAALARAGYGLRERRRLFTCSGFALAAVTLLAVFHLRTSLWATTACFSACNAFFGLAPSGFKANYLDITEEYVGIISGYGNTLGTVASFAQPKLLALILDSTGATAESTAGGSWTAVLATVAGANLLAAAFYFAFATVEPIERLVRRKAQ
jgi:MFS family permease